MQNKTHLNETTSFESDIWLADLVIIGVLLAVSSYLLAALSFYKFRVEKPQNRFLSLTLEKRYGAISSYICIMIGVVSIIRQVNGLARKLIELRERSEVGTFNESTIHDICNTLPSVGNITITIGSAFVFLFLWFRQRVLYVHPSLKLISNKVVKFISFGIIVVWLLFYISLFVGYFSLVQHHFTITVGCTVDKSVYDSYTYLVVSWTIVSILTQLGLLFLFLYPLLKSSKWLNQQQTVCNKGLLGRIKKAIVLASICLATDILTIAIRAIAMKRNGIIVLSIFTTNLVINHLMTIACFDHWRELVWPWKFCFKSVLSDSQQESKRTAFTSNNLTINSPTV